MPRKTADQWFAEYGESHQNFANELIHWICVPAIFFSVLGFIWSIPIPAGWEEKVSWFNWALVAIILAFIFYVRLAWRLAMGLLAFMSICYAGIAHLDFFAPWAVWKISLAVFVLAWIGQFIGHRIEGQKPSFLKDVVFLLIGPAWLMSRLYRLVRLKY